MTIYIARNSVYEDWRRSKRLQTKTNIKQCIKIEKWLQGWNQAGHEVSFNKSLERA